jgi:hypothetical protein
MLFVGEHAMTPLIPPRRINLDALAADERRQQLLGQEKEKVAALAQLPEALKDAEPEKKLIGRRVLRNKKLLRRPTLFRKHSS